MGTDDVNDDGDCHGTTEDEDNDNDGDGDAMTDGVGDFNVADGR